MGLINYWGFLLCSAWFLNGGFRINLVINRFSPRLVVIVVLLLKYKVCESVGVGLWDSIFRARPFPRNRNTLSIARNKKEMWWKNKAIRWLVSYFLLQNIEVCHTVCAWCDYEWVGGVKVHKRTIKARRRRRTSDNCSTWKLVGLSFWHVVVLPLYYRIVLFTFLYGCGWFSITMGNVEHVVCEKDFAKEGETVVGGFPLYFHLANLPDWTDSY